MATGRPKKSTATSFLAVRRHPYPGTRVPDDEDRYSYEYESVLVPYGNIQSWCRTVPYEDGMVLI